jgi:uncharacterized OB-fold protein
MKFGYKCEKCGYIQYAGMNFVFMYCNKCGHIAVRIQSDPKHRKGHYSSMVEDDFAADKNIQGSAS